MLTLACASEARSVSELATRARRMLCFLRCVPTLERVVVSYELAQRFFDVRRSLQLALLLRAELQMGPICTHSSSSVQRAKYSVRHWSNAREAKHKFLVELAR